jgi:hypothetical protein
VSWWNKGNRGQDTQSELPPELKAFTDRNIATADRLRDYVPGTPAFYQGQTVADLTGAQNNILNQIQGGAGGSATDRAAQGYLGSQLSRDLSGQSGAIQRGASDYLSAGGIGRDALAGMAGGGMGLGAGADYAMGGGAAQNALNQSLSGQVNPLTSQMYQQAAGDLNEQFQENLGSVMSPFASAGRTGSGAQARAMTDALGELTDAQSSLATNMFGQASESALNRQQQALGNELGRRQLGANLYEGGQNRALQAGQGLGQQGLSALGQLGGLYGTDVSQQSNAAGLAPAYNAMGWGNLQNALGGADRFQQQAQAGMDDQRARYEHNSTRNIQNWERQMQGLQGVQGVANPYLAGVNQSTQSSGKGKGKG